MAERCFFVRYNSNPVAGLSGQKSVRNILQSFQQDIHSAPQSTLDMNTKTPAITSTILIVCIYLLPPNDLSDCLGLHLSKNMIVCQSASCHHGTIVFVLYLENPRNGCVQTRECYMQGMVSSRPRRCLLVDGSLNKTTQSYRELLGDMEKTLRCQTLLRSMKRTMPQRGFR